MSFADHFSKQATDYAKYRPGYPRELFVWLQSQTAQHELAWDVGTGNGQAAVELGEFYTRVIATDPSHSQIENAEPRANVNYKVQAAEETDLPAGSVDLITVAQALHWFDFDRFYSEVRRVAKATAVFAAWTYALNEVTPAFDAKVRRYYRDIVGPYWPLERAYVEQRYQTIPFPFAKLSAPDIEMQTEWSLDDYLGYLRTWSATQRYAKEQQRDPIELMRAELMSAWGETRVRTVRWPLYVLAGKVHN